MGLHIVGNPNDYGGDDNPPEHGRDTIIWQELQEVITKYRNWILHNTKDIPNKEMHMKVDRIEQLFEEISEELDQPL